MQPRFAALLFVLGLADLAYVNLGLGQAVFGGAASGDAADNPGASPGPRPIEAVQTPIPAPAPPPVAAPSVTPSPSAPAPEASAPPATSAPPAAEASARPAPSPPAEPRGEPAPAPSVEPAPHTGDSPSAPAPAADAVPSAPRPAQAGSDAEPVAPIARAADLPDAALTVPFADTASAWLSAEAQAQLLELAAQLRAHPDYRIHIVGHADARGTREFNLDLGSRRARAVTELLARAGVSREQLEMESRGEDQPRVFGNSEQSWAANRRVEISIGVERSPSP